MVHVLSVAGLLLAAGCARVPTQSAVAEAPQEDVKAVVAPRPAVAKAPQEDVKAVVEGNNAFAVDLYHRLRTREGNLFFSPYSISTALAMTYAGARGETAEEMRRVLHFSLPDERLHPAFATLACDLRPEGCELNIANRLWGQKGYRFLDPFLELTDDYYGARLERLDFAGADEAARKTINAWVEEKTKDRITELLRRGDIDRLTRLGRAFNNRTRRRGASRRHTMSGGLEAGIMEVPRRLFGLARNIENGGSVTIIATCLIKTGSRMDQMIFEEFKGTGNSELVLDRSLAEARIFPAINIPASGTRKEAKLYSQDHSGGLATLRRVLSNYGARGAMDSLFKLLEKYPTNEEFLESMCNGS